MVRKLILDATYEALSDQDKSAFLGINPSGLQDRRPSRWREQPQHITKSFDNVTISSRFDSGNLEDVE